MTDRYQFADLLGWTQGQPDFAPIKENTFDRLRFHRGGGFVLIDGATMTSPQSDLGALLDRCQRHLDAAKVDTVMSVQAVADSYSIKYRRHTVADATKGGIVIGHAADLKDTPYVFGVTDCSWLSMHTYGMEGVNLVHNAAAQRADPQVIPIKRSQVLPGDLLFVHNDDHVALYLDEHRVWDTEPSDAPAPWGGYQGTGVQIRSTLPGYFCGWENVNGIGRVIAINGAP